MQQIPLISGLWNYLTAPDLPRTALAVSETHLALVALRRSGRELAPRNLGVQRLPVGLVRADFGAPNISDEATFTEKEIASSLTLLAMTGWYAEFSRAPPVATRRPRIKPSAPSAPA